MWYVNVVVVDYLQVLPCCFILTMWYVNTLALHYLGQCTNKFYTNYVVCKLVTKFLYSENVYGFILTMWYVNL